MSDVIDPRDYTAEELAEELGCTLDEARLLKSQTSGESDVIMLDSDGEPVARA